MVNNEDTIFIDEDELKTIDFKKLENIEVVLGANYFKCSKSYINGGHKQYSYIGRMYDVLPSAFLEKIVVKTMTRKEGVYLRIQGTFSWNVKGYFLFAFIGLSIIQGFIVFIIGVEQFFQHFAFSIPLLVLSIVVLPQHMLTVSKKRSMIRRFTELYKQGIEQLCRTEC